MVDFHKANKGMCQNRKRGRWQWSYTRDLLCDTYTTSDITGVTGDSVLVVTHPQRTYILDYLLVYLILFPLISDI